MVTNTDKAGKLIFMEGIGKAFGGVIALAGIDFDLFHGEVHALIGENGAGKSTLIKILSGVHSADQGNIWIKGKSAFIQDPRQAIELGIYTIYQETNLVPQLSVAENIFLGRYPRRNRFRFLIDWSQLQKLALGILKRFELEIDPGKKVRELGAAECQIVAIARALVSRCDVLILDEPTANLSQIETEHLFQIINRLKNEGVGIVYISHRLEELQCIGDRVTVLRDGKLVKTLTMAQFDINEIIPMMIGRRLEHKFPAFDLPIGNELLRVNGLSHPPVFSDISLVLKEGEILGIAGLIDSGRVEFVQALFGLCPYDSGSILVRGRESAMRSPKQAMKAGIGLLPGERRREGIIPTFSIKHNITIPILDRLAKPLGILNLKQESEIANDYKNRLRIKAYSVEQNIMSLSGGNQQKVVVVKTLCIKPEILVFIEPTRGIDVGTKSEIYLLLIELARQGHGIILVSSELPELLAMSHRIIVFHKGKLVSEFSRNEASQDKILFAAFGKGEV